MSSRASQALQDFHNENLPLPPEPFGNPPGLAEEAWNDWQRTPAGLMPRWWKSDPGLSQAERFEDFLLNLEASSPSSRFAPNASAIENKSDVALSLLNMLSEVRGRETGTPAS